MKSFSKDLNSQGSIEQQSATETISLFLAVLSGVLIQGLLNVDTIVLLNLLTAFLIVIPLTLLRISRKHTALHKWGLRALRGLHWYIRVLAGIMFRSGIFIILSFSLVYSLVGIVLTTAYIVLVYYTIAISRKVRSDWEAKGRVSLD